MSLPLHILMHFVLALTVGFFVGGFFQKRDWGVFVAFFGGFLIDLDHLLEYFLVFGWQFNLTYFLEGREFLLSDKIHLWFHAWEYVILFLGLGFIFKKRKILEATFIVLAFSIAVHLISDSLINRYQLKYYSLAYRAEARFAAEKLLSPDDYLQNLELKKNLGLE